MNSTGKYPLRENTPPLFFKDFSDKGGGYLECYLLMHVMNPSKDALKRFFMSKTHNFCNFGFGYFLNVRLTNPRWWKSILTFYFRWSVHQLHWRPVEPEFEEKVGFLGVEPKFWLHRSPRSKFDGEPQDMFIFYSQLPGFVKI